MDLDLTEFADLPEEARVWVYGFESPLDQKKQSAVSEGLQRFIPAWVSHQLAVKAAFKIVFGRFLIVAAHTAGGISGCSIDSLLRNLKSLSTDRDLNPLNGNLIFFRDGDGDIQAIDHLEFHDVATSGAITPDTPVFDTLIQNLGQLRAGEFEKAFNRSWHARTFSLAGPSPVSKAAD